MKKGNQGSGFRVQESSPWIGWLWILCVAMATGCSTPRAGLMDPKIKAFAEAADVAYQRGELDRADALYANALQRARLTDNGTEIAHNAYNLALCRMASGKPGEARNLLVQARVLMAGKGIEEARILLAEAEAARLAGAAVESGELARRAVTAGADREGRIQAQLLQAQAAVVSGNLKDARIYYLSANDKVSKATVPIIRARLDGLAVKLIQAQVMSGDIAAIHLSQAGWLKKAGQFAEMVVALNAAGEAFEQVENWPQAYNCRIRAAQSLYAAGLRDPARLAANRAVELAEKTGDINHKALAAGILGDLK